MKRIIIFESFIIVLLIVALAVSIGCIRRIDDDYNVDEDDVNILVKDEKTAVSIAKIYFEPRSTEFIASDLGNYWYVIEHSEKTANKVSTAFLGVYAYIRKADGCVVCSNFYTARNKYDDIPYSRTKSKRDFDIMEKDVKSKWRTELLID